jgi:hypothetical protein
MALYLPRRILVAAPFDSDMTISQPHASVVLPCPYNIPKQLQSNSCSKLVLPVTHTRNKVLMVITLRIIPFEM